MPPLALIPFAVVIAYLLAPHIVSRMFRKKVSWGASVFAWTPLIQATDFDGIRTDITTVSTGIITVLLIIVGIGLLVKVLGR